MPDAPSSPISITGEVPDGLTAKDAPFCAASLDYLTNVLARHQPRPIEASAGRFGNTGGLEGRLREAGVLVPLVLRGTDLNVLLTVRTNKVRHHAGQISFPGGSVDPEDASPTAAALREANEEINLMPERVTLLGELDRYATVTRFAITPVVGLIEDPGVLRPEPAEVATIFEMPLTYVLGADRFEEHKRIYDGQKRHFLALSYGSHFIWGATAAILRNLREIVLTA